jgi:hypothetical protein
MYISYIQYFLLIFVFLATISSTLKPLNNAYTSYRGEHADAVERLLSRKVATGERASSGGGAVNLGYTPFDFRCRFPLQLRDEALISATSIISATSTSANFNCNSGSGNGDNNGNGNNDNDNGNGNGNIGDVGASANASANTGEKSHRVAYTTTSMSGYISSSSSGSGSGSGRGSGNGNGGGGSANGSKSSSNNSRDGGSLRNININSSQKMSPRISSDNSRSVTNTIDSSKRSNNAFTADQHITISPITAKTQTTTTTMLPSHTNSDFSR